jgi:hypothetical protein
MENILKPTPELLKEIQDFDKKRDIKNKLSKLIEKYGKGAIFKEDMF